MKDGKTKWLTASVKASFGWPTERVKFVFRGYKYLVRPETDKLEPTVSVFCDDGLDFREGLNLINRFLSSLAWSQNYGVHVLSPVGSSTPEPIRIGKHKGKFISSPWKHIYLVRDRVDRVFFEALVRHIRQYGFKGRFYQRVLTYFADDELLYWTMGGTNRRNNHNKSM